MIKKGIIMVCGLIILWQGIVSIFGFPSYLFPPPWDVFKTIYVCRNLLLTNSLVTFYETLIGLFIGIFLGMLIAFLMIYFRIVRYWMQPILVLSQVIPTFIFAPLIVIWIGYGLSSKIVVTVFALFFPITSAFHDGLNRTPRVWLDLANSMQGKKTWIIWHVRFPAALPSLASGIRVAVAWAPMAAIIGEWVGASRGLGYLMLEANARLDVNLVFAALLVMIVFSFLLYGFINKILKTIITWR